jgi:hypothetical protein
MPLCLESQRPVRMEAPFTADTKHGCARAGLVGAADDDDWQAVYPDLEIRLDTILASN